MTGSLMPGAQSFVASAVCCAVLTGGAATGLAADVEISANTAAQAYEVANPWGSYRLERRRITESLGFSLYHLQGDYVPGKADYTARVMFRLDADVGINAHLPSRQAGGETNFDVSGGSRYIPGLAPARLDMMYAYVEGRNLAHGFLGFRVGRQYMTDVFGLWSFDGGLVRVTTPVFVEVEAYGGLEQRGGLVLSSSRYEQQGIWRGTHSDFGSKANEPRTSDFPSYQPASVAPAFGFAVESHGPNWIHGKLSYRRVYNIGDTITRQFADPAGGYQAVNGMRLSSDRIGYAANIGEGSIGGIKGGFTYDFYNTLVPHAFAGLEAYLGKRVTVGGDFDFYQPTFDADSIWNWFTKEPEISATGRVAARFNDRLSLSASGGPKFFFTEGDPRTFSKGECAVETRGVRPDGTALPCGGFDLVTNDPKGVPLKSATNAFVRDPKNRDKTILTDGLGQVALRYRLSTAKVELRSMAEAGHRGRRVGGDISLDKSFVGGMWALGGRVSLYNFHDPTRLTRDATSFGYVIGAGWKPLDLSKINIEWEHDINRLAGSRFRLLAMIDVLWIK